MTYGKDWMVGASTCSVGKATPEVVRAYAEAGLDAMEISLKAHEYAALDLPALRRAADDTGLTIWSLHLPFSNDLSIAHKDAQVRKKAMETNIALLRKLGENGISHAVVHPGTEPTADADRAERLKESRENLCLLTEEAIKDGVQLCVEELPRTCPGNCSEEMAYLLEAHPRLRLCFDTNHLLKESHEHFLNAVGSRVETLHVSDYDFIDERHQLPGEGQIDWQKLIAHLEQLDYKGPWMYEVALAPAPGRRTGPQLELADFVRNHKALMR